MLSTGLLGRSELFTSDGIIQSDVLRTMLDLICSLKHKSQLAGLGVLAGLALTSAEMAKKLLSPKLHQAISTQSPVWQLGQDQTCLETSALNAVMRSELVTILANVITGQNSVCRS